VSLLGFTILVVVTLLCAGKLLKPKNKVTMSEKQSKKSVNGLQRLGSVADPTMKRDVIYYSPSGPGTMSMYYAMLERSGQLVVYRLNTMQFHQRLIMANRGVSGYSQSAVGDRNANQRNLVIQTSSTASYRDLSSATGAVAASTIFDDEPFISMPEKFCSPITERLQEQRDIWGHRSTGNGARMKTAYRKYSYGSHECDIKPKTRAPEGRRHGDHWTVEVTPNR
jgi:hypothetical protein